MKSQQSSGFKPRPPNSKFSAPSGFQHEDRNYKVWDQPGLQIRMKSSYSKRAFEISRTSGQTGTQSPQDAAEKVQKHRTEPPFIRLILCARCCFVYISNLHNNTARRTLSSFCIDKGNKGSKINWGFEPRSAGLQSCALTKLNVYNTPKQQVKYILFLFLFAALWSLREKQCQR